MSASAKSVRQQINRTYVLNSETLQESKMDRLSIVNGHERFGKLKSVSLSCCLAKEAGAISMLTVLDKFSQDSVNP